MMFFAISTEARDVIMITGLILGALSAVFWMIVGWRAMRAHERLADSHEKFSNIASFIGAKYGQADITSSAPAPAPAPTALPSSPAITTRPDHY